MPKALTNAKIKELSLVFKTDSQTGVEFAPRNPLASVLAVKSGEAKPFTSRLVESLKAYFSPNYAGPYPVSVADDKIDNDGDGPEDYNAIVGAVCALSYDLQSCWCISDDGARSIAIVTAIDSFLEQLDSFRAGNDLADKAGKRHSKEDAAHIKAIGDKLDEAKAHVAALLPVDGDGKTEADTDESKNDKGDGEGEDDAKSGPVSPTLVIAPNGRPDFITAEYAKTEEIAIVETVVFENKAKAKDDKKPYGDVDYADEKNGKYPIDTKEHAKAAWSYINKEKNAAEYSSSELASVKSKIKAACKKFGIEISDDKAGLTTGAARLGTVNLDAIGDKVAAAMSTALVEHKAGIEKMLGDHTTAVTATVNARIDEVLAPVTEELRVKTEEASKLAASVKTMEVALARKATAPGGLPRFDGERLVDNALTSTEAPAPKIEPSTDPATAMKILLANGRPAST